MNEFSLLKSLRKGLLKGAPTGMAIGNGALAVVPGLDFSSEAAIYATVGGAVLGFLAKVIKNVLKQKYNITVV